MMQPMIRVSERDLLAEGFAKEVIFDRDGVDDPYDTLRVDIYSKAIAEGVALEVTHCHSLNAEGVATRTDSSVALAITECYAPLEVTSLEGLRIMINSLCTIFKQSEQ